MDKHQIDKLDLEHSDESLFGQCQTGEPRRRKPYWQQWLSVAADRLNDCQVTRRDFIDTFQGFYADAVLACHMYEYLIDTAYTLCHLHSIQGRSKRNFYFMGFASEVCDRIEAMIIERKSLTVSGSKSLVLQKSALVDNHFGVIQYGTCPEPRTPTPGEYQAHGMGLMDGKGVSIHSQIEGENVARLR